MEIHPLKPCGAEILQFAVESARERDLLRLEEALADIPCSRYAAFQIPAA